MPKGANSKLKLYYLAQIMLERTDEVLEMMQKEIERLSRQY